MKDEIKNILKITNQKLIGQTFGRNASRTLTKEKKRPIITKVVGPQRANNEARCYLEPAIAAPCRLLWGLLNMCVDSLPFRSHKG